tara:strand:- start:146440 stop:147606 length:1167 start_codon:yes stop_codon:yes gene_type:complete
MRKWPLLNKYIFKMKTSPIFLSFIFIQTLIFSGHSQTKSGLSDAELSMAKISALTAIGDLDNLDVALNKGLDNGLTINQIKEELVHLYAYSGFPRSLMAINTLIPVLEKRKKDGIEDKVGEEPTAVEGDDKYQLGKNVLADLTGVKDRPKEGYAEAVPIIEVFLKEHLFADIFKRGVLTYREREIITVSALISLGNLEPMARGHMSISMRLGISESQISDILNMIAIEIDLEKANKGKVLLSEITLNKALNSSIKTKNDNSDKIFPKGEKINTPVFTGTAWLTSLVEADDVNTIAAGVVTFEHGARTFWHQHPAGQIILVLSGEGYYQEEGGSKKTLQKGDVIKCPPNLAHWHGASLDREFVQIAITGRENGPTQWFKGVSDNQYLGN